jgi:Lrp/AsnC family transcriptional regulator, regulator for asnA, asnC and gidA
MPEKPNEKIKLDSIDRKILRDLLVDGRKSFSEIADECKINKSSVTRRYKQMVTKGIIVGATVQNSTSCYDRKLIIIFLLIVERGKTDEVLPLLKMPQIVQVFPFQADPFICVWAVAKDADEVKTIQTCLQRLQFVNQVEPEIFLGTRNQPENLSIFGDCGKTEQKIIENKTRIDEIDRLLIEKLSFNGRVAFSQISKELGITTETVSRRYEKLRNNGDIRVVIQIDLRKLGYVAFAFCNLKFAMASREILDKLSNIADITQIQISNGKFDYALIIMIKDIESYLAIQNAIKNMPELSRMEYSISEQVFPWPTHREFLTSE